MTQETSTALVRQIKEVDRRDEAQIMAQMSGQLVDEYLYEFRTRRGKRIVGLSWAGIREMAQLRGNIRVEKVDVQDFDDYIRAMASATDLERNVTIFGGCHQPKQMRVTDESTGEVSYIPDDFAYEKAISKAQRNAIKSLMPVTVITAIIDQFQGKTPRGVEKPLKSAGKTQGQKPNYQPPKDIPLRTEAEFTTGFQTLLKIAHNDFKLQPKQVWEKLGVSNQMEYSSTPWEAYCDLKIKLGYDQGPAQEPPGEEEPPVED